MDNCLPESVSLQLMVDDVVVFQSKGKWLYPLFDLEEHLRANYVDVTRATVCDKVIGKAAALLILRLNIGRIHGDLMSKLAMNLFEKNNKPFSFNKLVNSIDCKTEDLLLNIDNVETAYKLLCQRANRC